MTDTTTASAARPLPDTAVTRAHFLNINELLQELSEARRPDRAQAAYLLALLSFLTRWTAPRGLMLYVRDLCIEGQPIGRAVLEQVRLVAVHYGEVRDEARAIALAENEGPL